jgi:hypothetical protein
MDIDSGNAWKNNRVYFARKLNIEVSDIVRTNSSSLYHLKLGRLYASNTENIIEIDNLSYPPEKTTEELYKAGIKQSDLVKLLIPKAKLEGFNFQSIFQSDTALFTGNYLYVPEYSIKIIRDRRREASTNNQPEPPHVLFKNLPFLVKIDSTHFKNGYISYKEIPPFGSNPGKIWFEDTEIRIKDVSNIPGSKPIPATFTSKIISEDDIRLEVTFHLFDNQNGLDITGYADTMDLTRLSPALENTAQIKITSGKLYNLKLNANINDSLATGTLYASYKNLHFALLHPGTNKKKKITSFLANKVINANNLKDSDDYKVGDFSFKRKKEKNYFNYFWNSFTEGVYSILGVETIENVIHKAEKIIPFL